MDGFQIKCVCLSPNTATNEHSTARQNVFVCRQIQQQMSIILLDTTQLILKQHLILNPKEHMNIVDFIRDDRKNGSHFNSILTNGIK